MVPVLTAPFPIQLLSFDLEQQQRMTHVLGTLRLGELEDTPGFWLQNSSALVVAANREVKLQILVIITSL